MVNALIGNRTRDKTLEGSHFTTKLLMLFRTMYEGFEPSHSESKSLVGIRRNHLANTSFFNPQKL